MWKERQYEENRYDVFKNLNLNILFGTKQDSDQVAQYKYQTIRFKFKIFQSLMKGIEKMWKVFF